MRNFEKLHIPRPTEVEDGVTDRNLAWLVNAVRGSDRKNVVSMVVQEG